MLNAPTYHYLCNSFCKSIPGFLKKIGPSCGCAYLEETNCNPKPQNKTSIPATKVGTVLSVIIWLIMVSDSSMAAKIPISRSLAYGNEHYIAPTTPLNKVPSPTIQIEYSFLKHGIHLLKLLFNINALPVSSVEILFHALNKSWHLSLSVVLSAFVSPIAIKCTVSLY